MLERLVPKTSEQKMALENCVLLVKTGSFLHGTSDENSDFDSAGVYVPTVDFVVGFNVPSHVDFRTNPVDSGKKNTTEDVDCVLYSLKKFVELLAKNNPERLEYLFAPKDCLLHVTKVGQLLLDNRNMFLSKNVKDSFGEYADSQVKRLQKGEVYNHKMVSHALRLYYEGVELLKTGNLVYPLSKASVVKEVKDGKWDKDKFLKEAEVLKTELEDVPIQKRSTQGVRLMKLTVGDELSEIETL